MESEKSLEARVEDILNSQFVDQSIIIGFLNIAQSKFEATVTSAALQDEDLILTYLQRVWEKFHYKIVNFYKSQHKVSFSEAQYRIEELKSLQSRPGVAPSGEKLALPQLQPVEVRKLNDNYLKANKLIHGFYYAILKHFLTKYKLRKFPRGVLLDGCLIRVTDSVEVEEAVDVSEELQNRIISIVHFCVLSLGNLSRNRCLVDTNYFKPSLSVKNYYAFQKLAASGGSKKKSHLLDGYSRALGYYKLCTLLCPNDNVAYSHIGMIYNSVDEQVMAVYWFLRSQSTFEDNFDTGLNNLGSVMKKDYFKRSLVMQDDNMFAQLLCIIGWYYYPEDYRVKGAPKNITKRNRYIDVERSFLQKIHLVNVEKLLNTKYEAHSGENEILLQLVILTSFRNLIIKKLDSKRQNGNQAKVDLNSFDYFYIEYLQMFTKQLIGRYNSVVESGQVLVRTNILITLRFIFSIIRGIKQIRTKFDFSSICEFLNELTCENLPKDSGKISRKYLFTEDINFKGYDLKNSPGSLYLFADFQDTELINNSQDDRRLIYGDYSQFNDSDGIPNFIGEQHILNDITNKSIRNDTILFWVNQYENDLRERALFILGKKFLLMSNLYKFDETANKFVVDEKKQAELEKKKETDREREREREKEVSENKRKKSEKSEERKSEAKSKNPEILSGIKIDSNVKGSNNHNQKSSKGKSKTPEVRSKTPEPKTRVLSGSKKPTIKKQESKRVEIARKTPVETNDITKTVVIPDTLSEIESFIKSHTSQLHEVTGPVERDDGLNKMVNSLVLNDEPQSQTVVQEVPQPVQPHNPVQQTIIPMQPAQVVVQSQLAPQPMQSPQAPMHGGSYPVSLAFQGLQPPMQGQYPGQFGYSQYAQQPQYPFYQGNIGQYNNPMPQQQVQFQGYSINNQYPGIPMQSHPLQQQQLQTNAPVQSQQQHQQQQQVPHMNGPSIQAPVVPTMHGQLPIQAQSFGSGFAQNYFYNV